MTRLYEKNQLRFSLLWIAAYVAGASAADLLSASLGMEKSATFPLLAVLSLILLGWLRKNGLFSRYGLYLTVGIRAVFFSRTVRGACFLFRSDCSPGLFLPLRYCPGCSRPAFCR